jgi:hypothetical protein
VLFNDSVFVGLSEAVILYLIVFKNKEFEEELHIKLDKLIINSVVK